MKLDLKKGYSRIVGDNGQVLIQDGYAFGLQGEVYGPAPPIKELDLLTPTQIIEKAKAAQPRPLVEMIERAVEKPKTTKRGLHRKTKDEEIEIVVTDKPED